MTVKESFAHGFLIRALINFHEMSGLLASTGEAARWLSVSKPTAEKWLENMVNLGTVCKFKKMSHGKIATFWAISDRAWEGYHLFEDDKKRIDNKYSVYVYDIKKVDRVSCEKE